MSPFTLLYNTLRGAGANFPFISAEPYIHTRITFTQRWAEKRDSHRYTCSNGISL